MEKNKFHIGQKIEEQVRKKNMNITGFASKIGRSRNVAYDIFSRNSIGTELLKEICEILEYDFFEEYSRRLDF